jgi:transposase
MSQMQCYEWFKHFKESRMLVGEDPRPGRPSTSTNDDHVERVHAVICGNHLIVQEVADKVGISIGSCYQIFTEKRHMRHVGAKFMPRLLTDDQKENCVEISQELLANANGNEIINLYHVVKW